MMIYSVLFALRRGFANATIIIKHRKNRAILSITHLCAQDNARHRKIAGGKLCSREVSRRVMYKWERMRYNKT